jgi:hypothetical protein
MYAYVSIVNKGGINNIDGTYLSYKVIFYILTIICWFIYDSKIFKILYSTNIFLPVLLQKYIKFNLISIILILYKNKKIIFILSLDHMHFLGILLSYHSSILL